MNLHDIPLNEKYSLVIDTETSGLIAKTYKSDFKPAQCLSYGLIIYDNEEDKIVETHQVYIKFNDKKYSWDKQAESVHGLTPEYLNKNGVTMEEAGTMFLSILSDYWSNQRITLIGHRPLFDVSFMQQLTECIGFGFDVKDTKQPEGQFIIDSVLIDTAVLGKALLGYSSSNKVFKFCGFDRNKIHNSLDDANMTLETYKLFKNIFDIGRAEVNI